MSEQNFSAALRLTMPQIIRQYVRAFDRHQRARALESVSRFRRIPSCDSVAFGHFPRLGIALEWMELIFIVLHPEQSEGSLRSLRLYGHIIRFGYTPVQISTY